MDIPANPAGPKTTREAFAHINSLQAGTMTVEDLRILALTEAIGKELYAGLAAGTENAAVRDILLANGREELAHAHRISKAIEILTGAPFPIPAIDENPYYTPMPAMPVTKASLTKLAQGEFDGEQLYARFIPSFDNAEAVALLAQNGKEEADHGRRLQRAAALCEN